MTHTLPPDLDTLLQRYARQEPDLSALQGLESAVWNRIRREPPARERFGAWLAGFLPQPRLGFVVGVTAVALYAFLGAGISRPVPSYAGNGLAMEVFHYNAPALPSTALRKL
ncbi:MAG: hypothetical protein J0L97_04565 [Alphaproteobacteria bacterium]|nr:hypothetical protein [Alphaproteobacteria bacterium]